MLIEKYRKLLTLLIGKKSTKLVNDFLYEAVKTAVRFRPSPQKVTTEAVLVPEWLMGWIANPLFVSSILTQHSTGDIAQLGEHLVCNQEVVGSIPTISTRM